MRDPRILKTTTKSRSPKKPGEEPRTDERTVEDPGEPDKRLLALETEFSNVLIMMKREGSSLASVQLKAWDGSPLGSLTTSNPLSSAEGYITIAGHTTYSEIGRNLSRQDISSGLGNRYLWASIRRVRNLPSGGRENKVKVEDYASYVAVVQAFARKAGEITRSWLMQTRHGR